MSFDQAQEPLGAATKAELANWLGKSRNRAPALVEAMGVQPLAGKYPWPRLLIGVLGVELGPSPRDLLAPLLPLDEAADLMGCAPSTLKSKIETGKLVAPPMYVFGPRDRSFVRHQFIAFLNDARGAFPDLGLQGEIWATLSELARELRLGRDAFEASMADGSHPIPVRLHIKGGKCLYHRPHALRLSSQRVAETPIQPDSDVQTSAPQPAGILGAVARAAREARA